MSAVSYSVALDITTRTLASATDHELITAIGQGDEEAFQLIVQRYRTPIINFLYRMLSDYERAVDLSQETFLRIYTSAHKYQATHCFSTYIYRIASNLAISELRQRKRRKWVSMFTFWGKNDEQEEREMEIPANLPLQDDVMVADERRQAVAAAIQTLPEKYRLTLVLRDVEGLSYDEISKVTGLSEGTVKSRINRARNLLREKLEKYM
jgi:RNA polymerase sigma-70 factor, ECF subfamily